jgi:hypothetical protein
MTYYPDITLMKALSKGAKFNWYTVREDCEVSFIGVTIPQGFVSDFATVPRFLWSILPPHGLAQAPSVLHDYFYVEHPYEGLMGEKAERYFADDLFYRMLLAQKVSKWQAKAMYWAVRIFGKNRYQNHGKRKVKIKPIVQP